MRIGVLNGPNLDKLGQREVAIYGAATLPSILARLETDAERLGVGLTCFQSNWEGALVDWLGATGAGCDGLIVNAAGLTHTSVVLRDALLATGRPFVEVHLSNVFAREPFRHTSLLADAALGVISGFGPDSYRLALRGLVARLAGVVDLPPLGQ